MRELAADASLTDDRIWILPTEKPKEGIGIVEEPRGTLIHHYQTNENGVIEKANLIVATQNNTARIAMSVDKAAKKLISGANVPEGILNQVEMAFRAYDPCNGCTSHSLAGSMPLLVRVRNRNGKMLTVLRRDFDGSVHHDEHL